MPAFCQAIAQGCCRGVENVTLAYDEETSPECLSALIGALETDGALPALKTMNVSCDLGPGGIPQLARALRRCTAPQLEEFQLEECENSYLEALADMMEVRARIPGCKGLKVFEAQPYWFEEASPETRMRLLRALLPSVTNLHILEWDDACEPCFCEIKAPCLVDFDFIYGQDGGTLSSNALEAAPVLRRLAISAEEGSVLSGGALLSANEAMRRGALQKLEELKLRDCTGDGKDVGDFIDALAESGCATRLNSLEFRNCEVGAAAIRALAHLLCLDGFLALKMLRLSENPGIADVGVVIVAEGLLKATTGNLTVLDLSNVGMGDKGIAALAPLVSHGRFKQLEHLNLSRNRAVTNQGIIPFAEAIGAHGLPRLEGFAMMGLDNRKVTALGASALAHAVLHGSPILNTFCMECADEDDNSYSEVVEGMLLAAGREDVFGWYG